MLRLKKIQILGFKSFCDRTELVLPGEGIAAIVGPNGCGKSNISDAMSWVLGEQSAKSLRGGKMEDVIFAGTRDRKPTGMAEVSITLIDPDVYTGAAVEEPGVEVLDDAMEAVSADGDWDESALRAAAEADTEAAVAEAQPGAVQEGVPTPAEANPEGKTGVVLKIRRRKFQSAPRAGEIVVTRRLFRTGDSEYLLNGKLCRLRDIQDIFMGTGLGPESYAIIEQERIAQLLSSKPHDRRAVIEEAAGITRFKTKKRLAELRLEQSRQNLARIHDIFEEVTRQMNSLKRQASKAERYAALREEMRARLRVVLASRLATLDADRAKTDLQLTELAVQLDERVAVVTSLDAEQHADTERGYALDAEGRAAAQTASDSAVELGRVESRRRSNDERIAELAARHAARDAEMAAEREQLAQVALEREQQAAFLENASSETAAMREQAQTAQHSAGSARDAVNAAEEALEAARRTGLHMLTQEGHLRSARSQAEEALAALVRDADRLSHELEAAHGELATLGNERGQATLAFDTAAGRLSHIETEVAATQASLASARGREAELKQNLDARRTRHASLAGRCHSLDGLIREHGYSTDTVRQIFREGAQQGLEPVGTLADFLEVDSQYVGVVDEYLRDELNYIVVKSWDAAQSGMNLLRTDLDGRATFLVHPTDSQAKFSFAVNTEQVPPANSEGVFRLKDKVRVLDGFGRSLEVILPKLRDGYLAPDSGVARSLALENPDGFFLAPSGECFHNVTVTGGKPHAEGPLALKRELRESQIELESVTAEISQLETSLLTVSRELSELTQRLDSLQAERREAEREHANHGAALRQAEAEVHRLEKRVAEWNLEVERSRTQQSQRQQSIAQKQAELEAIERERADTEARAAGLSAQLESLRAAREETQRAAAEIGAQLATLEERHRAAQAQFDRTARMHDDLERRLHNAEQQQAAAVAEQATRRAENENLAIQATGLEQRRAVAVADTERLQAEAGELRARTAEREKKLRELRAAADQLRELRGELSSVAARLSAEIEHQEAACVGELGVEAASLREDTGVERVAGETLAAEEAELKAQRQRLEQMGPVNLMALEEYKEVSERHGFLEAQRADLLSSIENTEASIREIDEISRTKFDQAFTAINENFSRTFTLLFGGGQAYMKLTDADNAAESGIDIIASPPGKRMQNVLLLSGGEKALTALSLLVGIFRYQPSPFCVLDEVDAPLDETNVRRFASLVREMAEHTQFIVITHSKQTMQQANSIFGVTMQEPGVSKIVSVKLGGKLEPQRASA